MFPVEIIKPIDGLEIAELTTGITSLSESLKDFLLLPERLAVARKRLETPIREKLASEKILVSSHNYRAVQKSIKELGDLAKQQFKQLMADLSRLALYPKHAELCRKVAPLQHRLFAAEFDQEKVEKVLAMCEQLEDIGVRLNEFSSKLSFPSFSEGWNVDRLLLSCKKMNIEVSPNMQAPGFLSEYDKWGEQNGGMPDLLRVMASVMPKPLVPVIVSSGDRGLRAPLRTAYFLNTDITIGLSICSHDLVALEYFWNTTVLPKLAEKTAATIIAENNWLFLAAEHGNVNALDFLYSKGAQLYQTAKFEALELTVLGAVVHACNVGLNRELAKATMSFLINRGEKHNAKVTSHWEEERGYYTDRKKIQRSKSVRLVEYDTTGLLQSCIKMGARKSVKSRSDQGATAGSDVNLTLINAQLLQRIAELEAKVSRLEKENRGLKSHRKSVVAAQEPHRPAARPAASATGVTCRFFRPDVPGSCRNGSSCSFEHLARG